MSRPQNEGTADQRSLAIARFAETRHQSADDWSLADPSGFGEIAGVAEFWRGLDALEGRDDILAMSAAAKERLKACESDSGKARPNLKWVLVAAAPLAILGLPLSLWLWSETNHGPPQQLRPQILVNGAAPPRTLKLKDGVRLTLDANSKVAVMRWGPSEKVVTLQSGKAFFDVEHRPSRSLSVLVGGVTVTDIGTQFEVSLTPEKASVAILEGHVRVDPATSGTLHSITMLAGMRLDIAGTRYAISRQTTSGMAGWRTGVVRFDDVSLADAVAQLNQYLPSPVAVRSRDGHMTRISGVFRLDDPAGIVNSLSIMSNGGIGPAEVEGPKPAGSR